MAKIYNLADYRPQKPSSPPKVPSESGFNACIFSSSINDRVQYKRPSSEDFGDRIQRIRTSLEKINTLMAKLRREGEKNGKTD